MGDVKLAFRAMAKAPFVTGIIVASLALGIGANSAMYSVFDEILQAPLPVSHPERLVNLAAPGPKPGSQSCNNSGDCDVVFSYPMFRDLERAAGPFSGIAAHRTFGANVAYEGQTLNGEGILVSGSYFPVLGLTPALGRLIGPADDRIVGANFLCVLSYAYWQRTLGGDPGVLDRTLIVNGQSLTIVGVAPRGFDGTSLGVHPDVFVPITMRGLMAPGFNGFENRQSYWAYLFARLKPDVTIERARAAINAIYHPIITDVEAPLQEGMSDQTMARFRTKEIRVEDGRRGQSAIRADAATPIFMLLAITGIVLVIACANIANLLLARGANRASEMAVRLSLGATRTRLLAQLLTESLLLGAMGGVVSLVVAYWTLTLLAAILPAEATATFHVALRLPTLYFAAALSVATGLLFGIFPALHSTRTGLVTAIRNAAGRHSGGRAASRFRSALAVVQIAMSMALLVSAGLFVRSLRNVTRVDLGLDVDHVTTFAISPELNGYDSAQCAVLFNRLEEELAAMPGVTAVGAALVPVLAGDNWGNDVSVEGFEKGPDTDDNSRFNEVGSGYFKTLGVPILSGRAFTDADHLGAASVAIVNEAFARKFHLGPDAVGKHMALGDGPLDIEIVGLARDAKYSEVKDSTPPVFFLPYRQDASRGSLTFYVRSAGPPRPILRAIPRVVASLDRNLPVEELKTLPQQVRDNIFMDRMISSVSAGFAALATLLAALGLYGVLAYSVAQRTREIGVRKALGADARQIRRLVFRQVGLLTLIGGGLGLAGALGLGRVARSLLFGIGGQDPAVVAMATVVLALVAFGAGYIPALRASRVAPMEALRYE
jgi:predicted permease